MNRKHPQSRASKSRTPSPQRRSLNDMTPDEIRAWIQQTRTQLSRKMQRERAYLDRRAARGTSTPTDEAYEQDQRLQADLLVMLDEFEASLPPQEASHDSL